jgi:hypothetical protein
MGELERTAWAREVQRLEKQIDHRRKSITIAEADILIFETKRDRLLKKIADDYDDEDE